MILGAPTIINLVRLLVAVILLIALSVLGLILWQVDQHNKIIDVATNYHAVTSQYISNMRYETLVIRGYIDNISKQNLDSAKPLKVHHETIQSLHIISQNANQLFSLQKQYKAPELDDVVRQLQKQLQPLLLQLDTIPAEPRIQLHHINAVLLTLNQLERLHKISNRKLASTASKQESRRTNLILIFVLSTLLIGGLIFYKVIASIKTTLKQQQDSENRLSREKERIHTTLLSIGDAVITTDNAGRMTNLNPVAERLTGWSLAEALGKSVKKVFPIINASTREPIENPIEKVLATGEIVYLSNHTTLIAKDGTEYQIADSAAPIRDSSEGEILGMVLVFNDVTEKYLLREAANKNTQRLADAQRMAHIGNWELDLVKNDLKWSNEIYRIFEIDPDKFGASYEAFLDAIHPDDREKVNSAYTESLKHKTAYNIEHRLRMPDGRIKHVIERCQSFYDDDGNPIRSTGTVQDISERVIAENKLHYNEARLAESQQIAHLGSWDTDIATGETIWSEELYRLLGYEPYEVEARPENFYARVHKDDLDFLKHELESPFREKNRVYQAEFRIVLPDNSVRIVSERGKIIYDEQDEPRRYVGTTLDITERRNQEEKLRRSQKMDALGKLTGGIAHDYNNLLGIIMGYAEQLNNQLSHESKLAKYAQSIQHAAERGAKLTSKLLAFSRHKALDATALDINSLLLEQQLMLEKTLTARIKLTYDLADDVWPVELDSGELEGTILNLSINAQHAMEKGGELTLHTSNEQLTSMDAPPLHLKAGDYVQFSISDTGNGMDQATKERIFDPFFTTKGERGTGLGLSQVYGFVESSGGSIQVYSEPGHGSRFVIYFPRGQQTLAETQISTLTPTKSATRNLRGNENLLVVDDEQAMAELAHDILTVQGYQVITAYDGEEAVAILEQHTFDLIITDVIMPNMDGYQLAAHVKQHYPQIKIQLVSGFADNRHSNMTDDELHQDMLHKPYTSNTLLTRVRDLLDENGLHANTHINTNTNAKDILNERTILIMDDEKDVRELFKLNLEKLGCKTIPASTGDEAITLYKNSLENNQPIHAVILDLSIPGTLSGQQVAKKLRGLNPHVRIIVSSGHTDGPEMTRYQDYGFNAALEKNFNREKIKQVLESVLR